MCWEKLKGLFRSKTAKSPQELQTVTRLPPKEQPTHKFISTSHGGPNMLKKQPCPLGHGWKKRNGKTMGGASYYCNRCKPRFLCSTDNQGVRGSNPRPPFLSF